MSILDQHLTKAKNEQVVCFDLLEQYSFWLLTHQERVVVESALEKCTVTSLLRMFDLDEVDMIVINRALNRFFIPLNS